MPTLSMFFGIIIRMYREENSPHHKPHVHAEYQNNEAVISLSGEVLEGSLPNKKLRMVMVWMDIHAEELEANWKLLHSSGEAFKIDPLR